MSSLATTSYVHPNLLIAHASRYAARMLQAHPELGARIAQAKSEPLSPEYIVQRLEELFIQGLADLLPSATVATHSERLDVLAKSMRLLRIEVFCLLMERDLSGTAELGEVMQIMSVLAEVVLQRSAAELDVALHAQYGVARSEQDGTPQTLGIIGMGKLGGSELNVSSDIDVIFVYAEEGHTTGGTKGALSNHDYFVRLARGLIRVIDEHTAHGYVFRVDTRLRPNGHAGSLVCSLKSLKTYFSKQGRAWERYAWLKSRWIHEQHSQAGQILARRGKALVSAFVYQDLTPEPLFSSSAPCPISNKTTLIDAIRSMHVQIQQEEKRRAHTGLEPTTHQRLSSKNSDRDNIKLGRGGIREIEFSVQALQLLHGPQDVHFRSQSTLNALHYAAAKGYMDSERATQLERAYCFLRQIEHRLQYLDDAQTHTLPKQTHLEERQQLACSLGYAHYAAFLAALKTHQQCVEHHFDALFAPQNQPAIDQNASTSSSCLRWGSLALALWSTYTSTLNRVLHAITRSPWAAQHLARHPEVLPILLEPRAACFESDWVRFKNQLTAQLAHATPDAQMDLLRNAHQAEMFQIFLSDLAGTMTVEDIGDRLSKLADVVLDAALQVVWQQLPARYRPTPDIADPRFCIIAYGKLGGKELGYAGDLDLVFVYDDPQESGSERYSAFARRLMTYLTSATGAGTLFDVDLRLRPGGASGLLVTSMDALRLYQQQAGERANTASLWEHQALTRARYCAGDARIGADFEALRIQILTQKREAPLLAHDIVAMRQRVLIEHSNRRPLFDIKYGQGGMIDIEFAVQYLVLLHAADYPELLHNSGNIALLHTAAQLGLITSDEAINVSDAYRLYRALQHKLRLEGIDVTCVPPEQITQQRRAVFDLTMRIFETHVGVSSSPQPTNISSVAHKKS